MKGFVYILECRDKSLYVGSTNNLEERLLQHQRGEGAKYTRVRLPVKLIYFEEYFIISDAFNREKQLQGWSRKKKMALIEKDKLELKRLAAFRNLSHFSHLPKDSGSNSG